MNKFDLKNLKKNIKEFNPDIIHAHDYKASLLVAMSGFKGKIISHLHINAEFAKKWNIKSILYFLSIKKYDKVIGVSNSVLEEAIFKNKMKHKYMTLYNYVNKEQIIKRANEYNFEKKYDLFFFGRLNELKNPNEFIEIVRNLKEKDKNISAVMIGSGDLKESCQNLIFQYELNNNIELLGFLENPFPIIKQCKIGIVPSKVEGFGLTTIEAMVLSKPVLNSGVGGLSEIFKDNKNFICSNLDEYVDNILKMLNNDDLYCENARLSENIASKFANLEIWKEKLRKMYIE